MSCRSRLSQPVCYPTFIARDLHLNYQQFHPGGGVLPANRSPHTRPHLGQTPGRVDCFDAASFRALAFGDSMGTGVTRRFRRARLQKETAGSELFGTLRPAADRGFCRGFCLFAGRCGERGPASVRHRLGAGASHAGQGPDRHDRGPRWAAARCRPRPRAGWRRGTRPVARRPACRAQSRRVHATDRPFAAISQDALAKQLAAEFPGFKIKATNHYLYVYSTSEEFALATSRILESMFAGVKSYAAEQEAGDARSAMCRWSW